MQSGNEASFISVTNILYLPIRYEGTTITTDTTQLAFLNHREMRLAAELVASVVCFLFDWSESAVEVIMINLLPLSILLPILLSFCTQCWYA